MRLMYPSVGLIALALVSGLASPARADRSYPSITGTNVWNAPAPGFQDRFRLDPDLVNQVQQLNRDAAERYRACDAAIAQIEQTPPPPRRFARNPVPPPQPPAACLDLEALRGEATTLQSTLEEIERNRPKPATRTW